MYIHTDIGRAVACTRNGTRPDLCYNEATNFLVDLNYEPYLELIDELANNTDMLPPQITELVEFVDDMAESNVPLQDVLFGLPFYYMGK